MTQPPAPPMPQAPAMAQPSPSMPQASPSMPQSAPSMPQNAPQGQYAPPPPGYAPIPNLNPTMNQQAPFGSPEASFAPTGWAPLAVAAEPVSKAVMLAGLLQVAAAVLVPLGAALPFGDSFSSGAMWAVTTTWASFATLAALFQLAPFFGRLTGRPAVASWKFGAVAVGALIGFWVLIVLPGISSGQNFVVSLGVFAAALGLWLSPGRQL